MPNQEEACNPTVSDLFVIRREGTPRKLGYHSERLSATTRPPLFWIPVNPDNRTQSDGIGFELVVTLGAWSFVLMRAFGELCTLSLGIVRSA
ncbi:hypothetical protein CapIbe_005353 [Capra ibex]